MTGSLRSLITRWAVLGMALFIAWLSARLAIRYHRSTYQYRGGSAGTTVTLPDGSIVTLAPGSYLGTNPGFPTLTRVVHLYGQAHFIVTPNARLPFVVRTPGVHTRAIGTSFSIQADTTALRQITVDHGTVVIALYNPLGQWPSDLSNLRSKWHIVRTLTTGQALRIPFLLTWMPQFDDAIRAAGVPPHDVTRFGEALRHAAIRLGTEAARGTAARR